MQQNAGICGGLCVALKSDVKRVQMRRLLVSAILPPRLLGTYLHDQVIPISPELLLFSALGAEAPEYGGIKAEAPGNSNYLAQIGITTLS